jgi:hypothetical protein
VKSSFVRSTGDFPESPLGASKASSSWIAKAALNGQKDFAAT